jgi:hypothetical protein
MIEQETIPQGDWEKKQQDWDPPHKEDLPDVFEQPWEPPFREEPEPQPPPPPEQERSTSLLYECSMQGNGRVVPVAVEGATS